MENNDQNTMLDMVPEQQALVVAQPLFTPQEIAVSSWTSLSMTTHRDKAMVFNAISNPDHKIIDFVGKKIEFVDVYAQAEKFVDDESGEISDGTRVILFGVNGESYTCVSGGIKRSIQALFATFGIPPYNPPLAVIPALVRSTMDAKKNILKLNIPID